MEGKLEGILLNCLEQTVNVMVCCESTATLGAVNAQFSRFSVFNVFRARSLETFAAYLGQVPQWHCVVVDSRCTFGREVLSRLAALRTWTAVIVLGDSPDSMPLFQPVSSGAGLPSVSYLSVNEPRAFAARVQDLCIRRKLLPHFPDENVSRAFEMLMTRHPMTVDEWACAVESSPRKFQRIFKPFTELSPKKLIALYHAYRIAFELLDARAEGTVPVQSYPLDEMSRTRVMEYVLSRRSELLAGV